MHCERNLLHGAHLQLHHSHERVCDDASVLLLEAVHSCTHARRTSHDAMKLTAKAADELWAQQCQGPLTNAARDTKCVAHARLPVPPERDGAARLLDASHLAVSLGLVDARELIGAPTSAKGGDATQAQKDRTIDTALMTLQA